MLFVFVVWRDVWRVTARTHSRHGNWPYNSTRVGVKGGGDHLNFVFMVFFDVIIHLHSQSHFIIIYFCSAIHFQNFNGTVLHPYFGFFLSPNGRKFEHNFTHQTLAHRSPKDPLKCLRRLSVVFQRIKLKWKKIEPLGDLFWLYVLATTFRVLSSFLSFLQTIGPQGSGKTTFVQSLNEPISEFVLEDTKGIVERIPVHVAVNLWSRGFSAEADLPELTRENITLLTTKFYGTSLEDRLNKMINTEQMLLTLLFSQEITMEYFLKSIITVIPDNNQRQLFVDVATDLYKEGLRAVSACSLTCFQLFIVEKYSDTFVLSVWHE